MNKKFLGGLCALALSVGLLQSQSSVTPVLAQNSGEGLAGSAPYDFESMKPVGEGKFGNSIWRFYGCVRLKLESVKCVVSLTGDKSDQRVGLSSELSYYVSTAGQVFPSPRFTYALPDEKDHNFRTIFGGITTATELYFNVATTTKSIPILEFGLNDGGNQYGNNVTWKVFRLANVLIR